MRFYFRIEGSGPQLPPLDTPLALLPTFGIWYVSWTERHFNQYCDRSREYFKNEKDHRQDINYPKNTSIDWNEDLLPRKFEMSFSTSNKIFWSNNNNTRFMWQATCHKRLKKFQTRGLQKFFCINVIHGNI
jgi:hypothetical protein